MHRLFPQLQQVLEVDVLFVRHVLETILSMHVDITILLMSTHRIVDKVSWKTSCLTFVTLFLLHPCNVNYL